MGLPLVGETIGLTTSEPLEPSSGQFSAAESKPSGMGLVGQLWSVTMTFPRHIPIASSHVLSDAGESPVAETPGGFLAA